MLDLNNKLPSTFRLVALLSFLLLSTVVTQVHAVDKTLLMCTTYDSGVSEWDIQLAVFKFKGHLKIPGGFLSVVVGKHGLQLGQMTNPVTIVSRSKHRFEQLQLLLPSLLFISHNIYI
jgi:hypothetical protein